MKIKAKRSGFKPYTVVHGVKFKPPKFQNMKASPWNHGEMHSWKNLQHILWDIPYDPFH